MATTKAFELGQLGSKLTIHSEDITLDGNVHSQYAGFDSDMNASSIGDLSNVDITTSAPSNNQSLIWDNANSKFVPGDSFSQSDFNTAFGNKSTSDLSEGTNEYHTTARARSSISATGSLSYNSSTGVMSFTQGNTDTISEGSSNLYYTDARADARVSLIVDAAPGTLNTLNELAAALGDDANFSTTVTNSIATKLPYSGGTMTGNIAFGSDGLGVKFYADNYLRKIAGTGMVLTTDSSRSLDILLQFERGPGGTKYKAFHDSYHPNADTLTTARTINGVSFNGSANITVADSTKLPLSGGTMTGNLTVGGSGSTGNAFAVDRGSDSNNAFRVQNSGEVIVPSNYFYASATGTSMYVQNDAVFRGNIRNDTSGQPVTITDDLAVTGTVDGRDVAADGTKLDGIETGATADQTAAQLLTAIKTVDGSSSGLDADLLDGWHQTEIVGLQSFSDFPLGTLVTTNINSSGTNGDSFVIQVTGKAYGSSRPHTIIAEGYLYNNTIISTGGTNIAGSNFTYLKVMNNNGVLSFWWPRHGYWNSYDVHVRSSSAGTNSKNRVTAITNSSDPSGATKKIQINLAKSWNDANDGAGSGLDADTVDGIQASSFLRSDVADNGYGFFTSASVHGTGDSGIGINNGSRLGFDQAGTRSWSVKASGGNLAFASGDGNGTYTFSSNITSSGNITANSDISLKDNITPIPNALDKVLQIRGVTFNRNDIEDNPRHAGVIAQEVEKVLPEVVSEGEDGIKSVAYGNMVSLLIEAIKEQQEQIDMLKEKLESK